MNELIFDEIGAWSEIKIEIIRNYATEYSKILAGQSSPRLNHVYIDGFSGGGINLSRRTGELITGSPLSVLEIKPPFREFHFVDLDGDKAKQLATLTHEDPSMHVHTGDCNKVLIEEVFPRARYDEYRRALCLLDPYGLQLGWSVIDTAAKMKSIELFVNFPVMDINRNVLWKNPTGVKQENIDRMNAFWGDDSWRQQGYKQVQSLFGVWDLKAENEDVAEAFQRRLKDVAGFAYVPKPVPMKNKHNAVIYYLFFAAHKPVAAKIVTHIFDKYRRIAHG